MKKHDLKLLITLPGVLFTCLWGCTDHLNDYGAEQLPDETIQTPTVSLADAVYHEGTESWALPRKDPYTLENFQKAYDSLASGHSVQTLTKAQTEEFSDGAQLKATHYCLKIFPKNENEQWKIELMEDVKVAYIPFNYVQLPETEAAKLTGTRSEAAVFLEESRYIVTYDSLETIDGPVETVTYTSLFCMRYGPVINRCPTIWIIK